MGEEKKPPISVEFGGLGVLEAAAGAHEKSRGGSNSGDNVTYHGRFLEKEAAKCQSSNRQNAYWWDFGYLESLGDQKRIFFGSRRRSDRNCLFAVNHGMLFDEIDTVVFF